MTDFQLISARTVRLPERVLGQAILVADGLVVGHGDQDSLLAEIPRRSSVDVHAYPGAVIIPGLRDSHLHPVAYAALLAGVTLHRAANMSELQSMLTVAAGSKGGSVIGWNLDEGTLAERRLPTAADLDAAVPDRPALVHRYDGHLAIANSITLHLAGIDAATPDPPGGIIDRDADGRPTGVVRETAIDLVTAAPGIESRVDPSAVAMRMRGLAQLGITSIGAMVRSGRGAWAHLGDEAKILAAAAGDATIRIHTFITADTTAQMAEAASAIESAGALVRWVGVKRFADGSFGSRTAAMMEPFADSPGNTGTMRLNDLDIAMARSSITAGGIVAIHAIGDAAASRVLDVFEELVEEGVAPHRLRMEHASVLSAADIERMGRLGLVASVQPAFLGSETDWIEDRVGPDRLKRTYAFASLLRAGALLVGGSDCPVESPNPWEAMALARDRAGLVPDEALSASEALAMYTTAAALALGEPEPLAVGSPADLAIVDRDPIETTPDELRETAVIATYVGGGMIDVTGSGSYWIEP